MRRRGHKERRSKVTIEERKELNQAYSNVHREVRRAKAEHHRSYLRGVSTGIVAAMRILGYSQDEIQTAWLLPQNTKGGA